MVSPVQMVVERQEHNAGTNRSAVFLGIGVAWALFKTAHSPVLAPQAPHAPRTLGPCTTATVTSAVLRLAQAIQGSTKPPETHLRRWPRPLIHLHFAQAAMPGMQNAVCGLICTHTTPVGLVHRHTSPMGRWSVAPIGRRRPYGWEMVGHMIAHVG